MRTYLVVLDAFCRWAGSPLIGLVTLLAWDSLVGKDKRGKYEADLK